MSLSRFLVALFASTVVLAASPMPAQAAAAEVDGDITVACASSTLTQDADWFFPSSENPAALVFLQHGFSRSNSNVFALARKYQAAGFLVFAPQLPSSNSNGCTVNNTGSNPAFLNNVAAWLGTATTGGPLAVSYAAAATKAGRTGTTLPAKYVLAGHSAGGDAVTYIANRLRTTHPSAFTALKLLQLLDPVKSPSGTNMADGLTGLAPTSLPIYTVSSPPYLSNSQASGTVELQNRVDRPFLGVRLTTGSHCDAEGSTTNFLCTLTGGASKAQNVTALQTFTVNWAADAVAGTTTATYYPGGTYYQGLLTSNVIQTIS
ncbi:hypothetical protein FB565_004164 [Actinoplanes lutulentus]|uniref:Chlorophyllase-like protein n=1 Tax=Actinoplanes lutulentus TaxID=1287878 RepID=A0A327ZHZ9_9ACTN|nr:alpha/beta hydrolase [Actinoplanes lutulentus]MBB2944435.1 hypothetical protein [Actinoplanes lutulentus]RAK42333.1 hypothetical protein B0I29_102158 [Actinoplanes lutulentus]